LAAKTHSGSVGSQCAEGGNPRFESRLWGFGNG
jgi:hypothetical protein